MLLAAISNPRLNRLIYAHVTLLSRFCCWCLFAALTSAADKLFGDATNARGKNFAA